MNQNKYAAVEEKSGVEFKWAMGVTALYIALHLGYGEALSSTVFIFVTALTGAAIWWFFRRYFQAVGDYKTAKWITWIIGVFLFYGLLSFLTTVVFELGFALSLGEQGGAVLFSILRWIAIAVILSSLIIFVGGIKIIAVNSQHKFHLKRIALSSMLLIPLFLIFQVLGNMSFIWQTKELNDLIMVNELTAGPTAWFYELFAGIRFYWNVLMMVPYYFLFYHFYRADRVGV